MTNTNQQRVDDNDLVCDDAEQPPPMPMPPPPPEPEPPVLSVSWRGRRRHSRSRNAIRPPPPPPVLPRDWSSHRRRSRSRLVLNNPVANRDRCAMSNSSGVAIVGHGGVENITDVSKSKAMSPEPTKKTPSDIHSRKKFKELATGEATTEKRIQDKTLKLKIKLHPQVKGDDPEVVGSGKIQTPEVATSGEILKPQSGTSKDQILTDETNDVDEAAYSGDEKKNDENEVEKDRFIVPDLNIPYVDDTSP